MAGSPPSAVSSPAAPPPAPAIVPKSRPVKRYTPLVAGALVLAALVFAFVPRPERDVRVVAEGTDGGTVVRSRPTSLPRMSSGGGTTPQNSQRLGQTPTDVKVIPVATRSTGSGAAQPQNGAEETDPAEPEQSSEPLLGSMRVASAQLFTEETGAETGRMYGTVTIINDGDYAITDYRLTLEIGGTTYSLRPVDGGMDGVQSSRRTIPAGSQLSVPVMASGLPAELLREEGRTVTVQARIAGPPGTLIDSVTVL
ncbi:MAG TPA: hypothetical protein VEX38_04180 [Fimbriimonadaceae bacterium]|nr:hypothetical protein [Fimbriimonadaceae bacterium]